MLTCSMLNYPWERRGSYKPQWSMLNALYMEELESLLVRPSCCYIMGEILNFRVHELWRLKEIIIIYDYLHTTICSENA